MPTKMEATFYDESVSGSNSSHQRDGMGGYGFNPKTLKQSMTLNLNDPKHFRPHLRSKAIDILTSPDVGLLKLASPELERLIIASCNGLTTPTPTQFFCPKNITDEQEGFAEGFVRALAELHYQQHGMMPPAGPGGASSDAQQQQGAINSAVPPASGGGDDMPPAAPGVSESGIPPYSCTVRAEPPEYTNLGTSSTTFNRAVSSSSNNSGGSASAAAPTGAERHSNTSYPPAAAGTGGPSQSQHTMDPLLAVAAAQQRGPPPPRHHHNHHHHHHHHQQQHAFKEEPQTVPEMSGDTPPLSPIDMESQERIKAERKRMRNRVAASKCRKRKLERISRLEDRVKNLKSTHTELVSSANVLRDELALLKQKVMDHVNSGCQLILTQQLQAY